MNKWLPIGTWAIYERVATFPGRFDGSTYTRKRLIELCPLKASRIGQICGVVKRFEGHTYLNNSEEGNYFEATKGYWLYQIKTSLTGKPDECLPEDVRDASEWHDIQAKAGNVFALPFKVYSICPLTPEDLRILSEEAKRAPRDSKGRFIKGGQG